MINIIKRVSKVMVNIKIDGVDYEVEDGLAIIQACEIAGVEVPRFCYHEKLSVAGNCRMCLVDVEDSRGLSPKPVASCAMQVSEGLHIYTCLLYTSDAADE